MITYRSVRQEERTCLGCSPLLPLVVDTGYSLPCLVEEMQFQMNLASLRIQLQIIIQTGKQLNGLLTFLPKLSKYYCQTGHPTKAYKISCRVMLIT